MRKRTFSISYTHDDDIDNFLTHEKALHLSLTPKWVEFWKDSKNCNIDCVLLLDTIRREGRIYYRSQQGIKFIINHLSRYNIHVLEPEYKDQQSHSTIDNSQNDSRQDSPEAEPYKQRNLENRDNQLDNLYKIVDKLKEEIATKKDELANMHLQIMYEEDAFAQKLESSTKQMDSELNTQKRITSFMLSYLLPEHLYTLQHLPEMDKLELFNRLHQIDSIACLPQAKSYAAGLESYQSDYSVLRQDFNINIDINDRNYCPIDKQYLNLKDSPTCRPLPIPYIDAQNFIQAHLIAIRNNYTTDEDAQAVLIKINDQDLEIQVSVERTIQSVDFHKNIMDCIDMTERQAGLYLITTENHHSLHLPILESFHKTVQWHIKPVACNDHFWVVAYHVDVENRQFHLLTLDSEVVEGLIEIKNRLNVQHSLAQSGYKMIEYRNVSLINAIGESQLNLYNSGRRAIHNIKALLDLKERWWDLHLGMHVDLNVESDTSTMMLIRHAELVYFCMVHEQCNRSDGFADRF